MVALLGRRPDGSSVRQQAAFFAHGLRIYQASVLGSELPAEATETFFLGLKLVAMNAGPCAGRCAGRCRHKRRHRR